ncbi:helix-turn-helix domain-containing protein [uncultured Brachybacterium sp.]|uniref:helix-turn-helix domain-containing protein n=1 Tax=uncultured Brachybacterium sp. TaxID=189680 RepID=UPI002611B37E|nr:helix-turn-helix domain-containing protein [uncultured Brachybacterium sp.]
MNKTRGHLTPTDLSERFGVPLKTLAAWRYQGTGPAFMKLGGAVRYRLEDVEAYETENMVGADR